MILHLLTTRDRLPERLVVGPIPVFSQRSNDSDPDSSLKRSMFWARLIDIFSLSRIMRVRLSIRNLIWL